MFFTNIKAPHGFTISVVVGTLVGLSGHHLVKEYLLIQATSMLKLSHSTRTASVTFSQGSSLLRFTFHLSGLKTEALSRMLGASFHRSLVKMERFYRLEHIGATKAKHVTALMRGGEGATPLLSSLVCLRGRFCAPQRLAHHPKFLQGSFPLSCPRL